MATFSTEWTIGHGRLGPEPPEPAQLPLHHLVQSMGFPNDDGSFTWSDPIRTADHFVDAATARAGLIARRKQRNLTQLDDGGIEFDACSAEGASKALRGVRMRVWHISAPSGETGEAGQ